MYCSAMYEFGIPGYCDEEGYFVCLHDIDVDVHISVFRKYFLEILVVTLSYTSILLLELVFFHFIAEVFGPKVFCDTLMSLLLDSYDPSILYYMVLVRSTLEGNLSLSCKFYTLLRGMAFLSFTLLK